MKNKLYKIICILLYIYMIPLLFILWIFAIIIDILLIPAIFIFRKIWFYSEPYFYNIKVLLNQ